MPCMGAAAHMEVAQVGCGGCGSLSASAGAAVRAEVAAADCSCFCCTAAAEVPRDDPSAAWVACESAASTAWVFRRSRSCLPCLRC